MDGGDGDAALAAKKEVARLLADAQLSFAAIAEQLEQRRLLMPPDIIAALKRIDLPGEGDAAFVGARKLLSRAKLSFQDIAQALEHRGVSSAEHAALAQEFAVLRNVHLRQQGTIAGLKLRLGFSWFGGFRQRSWRRIILLSAALMVAVLAFTAGRGLVEFGRGLARTGADRRVAVLNQTAQQATTTAVAAQHGIPQAAVGVTQLPATAERRTEHAPGPPTRSVSRPVGRATPARGMHER